METEAEPDFALGRGARYVQCDRHGTKITANLQWNGNTWLEDLRYLGHNGSWRP